MKPKEEAQAALRGYQARIDGFPIDSNPYTAYPRRTDAIALKAAWVDGWKAADNACLNST